MNWSFPDSPDVIVFTSKYVIDNGDWIHCVSHDEDDGAWQFHSINGAPETESEARIVLLRNIVELDSSLNAIADLPIGWIAWRDTADGPWKRGRRSQE